MSEAIQVLRDAFRHHSSGEALNQPRRRIQYGEGLIHYMAAAAAYDNSVGLKAYVSTSSGTQFVVLLFAAETGAMLSVMEADWLGRIRTGAASGVATDALARPEARRAGVIGAGKQAETQVQAIDAVRELDSILVFCRNAVRREELANSLNGKLRAAIEPASSARNAIEGSDIVVTITTSGEPVFDGSWLKEGAHVNAAGSNSPRRRELDDKVFERAA